MMSIPEQYNGMERSSLFPPPGYFPIDLARDDWSFSSSEDLTNASVSIYTQDGKEVPINFDAHTAVKNMYGLPTIRIAFAEPVKPRSYFVLVKNGETEYHARVTPVECTKQHTDGWLIVASSTTMILAMTVAAALILKKDKSIESPSKTPGKEPLVTQRSGSSPSKPN